MSRKEGLALMARLSPRGRVAAGGRGPAGLNCARVHLPAAMPTYSWSCLACEASNPATATTCGRCGCPAAATREATLSASAAWRRRAGLPEVALADPLAMLAQVAWLPVAAVACLLVGALMLIVDMGASTGAFGGLMISLAALCASAHRPRQTA